MDTKQVLMMDNVRTEMSVFLPEASEWKVQLFTAIGEMNRDWLEVLRGVI